MVVLFLEAQGAKASNAAAEHSLNCAGRAIRRNMKPEKFNLDPPAVTHL